MQKASRSRSLLSRCATPCLVLLAAHAPGLPSAPAHAQASPAAATEKELLATFQKSFADPDTTRRAEALNTLGEATRDLPDKGVGKRVAQALAKGLEDDEPEVRDAALVQLSHGREVDTTIPALDELLRAERARIEDGFGNSAPAARDQVSRGTVLFKNGCSALATYPDERSAASLIALLRGVRGNTKDSELATCTAGPLATAALTLGTQETVEAVVKLTKTLGGKLQEPAAREVHAALREFASRAEFEAQLAAAPAEWTQDASAAWQAWLEAICEKLPKKLGRLTAPPMSEPVRAMEGLPGKNG